MNRSAWSMVAILLIVSLKSASATDPYPIDSLPNVKTRWAEAASGITRMHAEIKRIEYDHVYRVIKTSEGTLDFERPNRCRIELRSVSADQEKPVKIDGVEYTQGRASPATYIWNDEGVYWIVEATQLTEISAPASDASLSMDEGEQTVNGERPLYDENPLWELIVTLLGPRHDPPAARPDPPVTRSDAPASQQIIFLPSNWGSSFWKPNLSLQDVVPILLSSPDAIAEQGFTLKEKRVQPKGLCAVPYDVVQKRLNVERINILIDPITGLPYATQTIRATTTVVHILKNVQLNPTVVRGDIFEPTPDQLRWAQ